MRRRPIARAHARRAALAPSTLVGGGGTATMNANKQADNGQRVLLGTWNFASGSAERVRLSCWTTAGYNVIADAVRFYKP